MVWRAPNWLVGCLPSLLKGEPKKNSRETKLLKGEQTKSRETKLPLGTFLGNGWMLSESLETWK